ncbi:MAG: thiamine-phosphate kinase [Pseudomonadota bacterium]
MDEFDIIHRLFRPLTGTEALALQDDGAILAPSQTPLVITTDTMTEGVHFLPATPAHLIARKLLRVNLSDLAAMAAVPKGYTLTLTGPFDEAWLTDFAAGLGEDQPSFGVHLWGGDTCAGRTDRTATITAFGHTDNPLRRKGALPGDWLVLTAPVGEAAAGLALARGDIRPDALPPGVDGARLLMRYHLPTPRTDIARAARDMLTAGIDISDGLFSEAEHLAKASAVGLDMREAGAGISLAALAAMASTPELHRRVWQGGDDYELLLTIPPDAWPEFKDMSKAHGGHPVVVGTCTDDPHERLLPKDLPADLAKMGWADFRGWRHPFG